MRFRSPDENAWYKAGPVLGRPVSDWRYQRPVMKGDKCCRCGWCSLICPTGCIRAEKGRFIINLDYCKGCGICARECPVSAITMVPEEVE